MRYLRVGIVTPAEGEPGVLTNETDYNGAGSERLIILNDATDARGEGKGDGGTKWTDKEVDL